MTPEQLFKFAIESIKGVDFEYSTHDDYLETEKKLLSRFDDSKAITGTQKLHTFIPVSKNKLLVKLFASSIQNQIETVKTTDYLTQTDIGKIELGYVTVTYDKSWWLACILEKNYTMEFKVSFLHPRGQSHSFYFPKPIDTLTISSKTILQPVNPTTATGRVYTLNELENSNSTQALIRFLQNL